MREIKFRAWDKRSGVMTTHFAMIDGKPMRKNYDGIYFVETELEVMEFTGLKDKHGKEIYEGDIIRHQRYTGNDETEIIIIDDFTGFLSDKNYQEQEYAEDWESINLEIIGNKFENPELLK